MAAETLTIPISRVPIYEAAALFLSALAYPSDPNRREQFVKAYCKVMIQQMAEGDNEYANSLISFRPVYLTMTDSNARKFITHGYNGLQDRKIAFVSTLPLFEEKLSGKKVLRLNGYEDCCLPNNATNRHLLANWWMGKNGDSESNAKNVTDRYERPARAIIHAAVAFWGTVLVLCTGGGKKQREMSDVDAMRFILNDVDLLSGVVRAAERLRPVAASIPSLKVSEAEQIQFVAV
jgi:hypothetical protein